MSGLHEFLLARIAEDEAGARRAATVAPRWQDSGSILLGLTEEPDVYMLDFAEATNYRHDAALTHAARHDPARVLAECAAKRDIVEYRGAIGLPADGSIRPGEGLSYLDGGHSAVSAERERILRLLALPYADHPDYNESWRP